MTMAIRVVCGKGTYIRALARDIGAALHSGAFLTSLRRTRVGDYRVDDAITLDNSNLTPEQQLQWLIQKVEERIADNE